VCNKNIPNQDRRNVMKNKRREMEKKANAFLASLILIEVVVFLFLVFTSVLPYTNFVFASAGEDNVTVDTILEIGNVAPEILNVTINNNSASIDLSPNGTVVVDVYVIARDYNNDTDIQNITADFYDNANSEPNGTDDDNFHYSNDTCLLNRTYGDQYELNATCSFTIQYFANNGTWNATATATDADLLTGEGNDSIEVNTLIALSLPDTIAYGEVNASTVSDQQIANVTNAGNTIVNLSLSGYGVTVGDGLALNCTLGTVQNISIEFEKYNLTYSDTAVLNLTSFEFNHTNLTSSPVTHAFNLPQRQDDTARYLDDTNASYWRVYVPAGVAGTCTGNIVFGGVLADA